MDKQLFALGRIVATPGALEAMSVAETNGFEYLARHVQGDWGDLGQEENGESFVGPRGLSDSERLQAQDGGEDLDNSGSRSLG